MEYIPGDARPAYRLDRTMNYALQTLWYERGRFFPGVVAVMFSALLIGLQCGLMLGIFSGISLAVDQTQADVWVGNYGVASVDQGQPIDERLLAELAVHPEVRRCEIFVQGRGLWHRPDGAAELCMVVGSRLEEGALGAMSVLTAELRARLTEPNTVVIDESDMSKLGVSAVGEFAEISDRRVRVVGTVRGVKGMANAYVLCSIRTARRLLYLEPNQAVFLLGRCRNPEDAATVVGRFANSSRLTAFTREGFSRGSRLYWLTKSKAGIALGWTAILGLVIGAAITGQTLYAATAGNLREYAVLRALGIPRWRMEAAVAWQCLGVAVIGTLLAIPAVFLAALLADLSGLHVLLPPWLLASMTAITLVVALLSGLAALRLLRSVDPVLLLR
jgi:putative ABC transport system permease protein